MFFERYGDHRESNVLNTAFHTRRASVRRACASHASESDQKRDTRPRTTTGCPGERSSTPPARPIDQPPGDIHEAEPWRIGVAGEIARPRSTSCDDSATDRKSTRLNSSH